MQYMNHMILISKYVSHRICVYQIISIMKPMIIYNYFPKNILNIATFKLKITPFSWDNFENNIWEIYEENGEK